MEFENEFDVEAPIEEVYATMLDLERVAPAMPGAQVLDKVDDDNYKVAIKVKVGPVSMQYRGDVQFVEKDPEQHLAKMHVKAREARGQGTATADVVLSLEDLGAKTHAKMKADVQLAGKAASMGRGIIQDVSARLVQQFANNLATMLAGEKEEPVAAAAGAAPAAAGGVATAAAQAAPQATADGDAAAPKPTPAAPPPPAAEAEGIDVLSLGASMAKERAGDPKIIAIVVAFVVGFLLGRRSS
jgi:carbon monoxide dehydrogenase subunit G